MNMTHYMELLATNQPWNLIIFMAVPVVLAETIAVTELYLLFTNNLRSWVRQLNRVAGILVGLYFTGIFLYLINTVVIPLTRGGLWRGPADVIAVGFYLAGIIPLLGIALLELGILGKQRDERGKLQLHATFVALFLIVAHIAMIAGMLSPEVLGWHNPAMPMPM